jgi:geranylgeranyl pyrophosphate synthase
VNKILLTAYADTSWVPLDTERRLAQAIKSVLKNPGSLTRAHLAYGTAISCGLSALHASYVATAVEYFHTASLLLDDLPCMDSALERRGKPCTYIRFGEATAVLAAQAFIARAYDMLMWELCELPISRQVMARRCIRDCVGVGGILNGQSKDLHSSRASKSEIAAGKTGSLFRLALVLPALMGDATPDQIQQLEAQAARWGLCYQALDDLRDGDAITENVLT